MAISGCMSCLKTCGYLCGGLAALNIWFWLGMTIFNSMDNLWLKKNVMKYEGSEWATADASKFTTIFGMCILVSYLLNFVALSLSKLNHLTFDFCCSWMFFAWLAAVDAPRVPAIRTKTRLSTMSVEAVVTTTRSLKKESKWTPLSMERWPTWRLEVLLMMRENLQSSSLVIN